MAMKDISDTQVCRAVQEYQDRIDGRSAGGGEAVFFPYETLAADTGQPEKVCYRALERAEQRGLIECGVSLRTGWLTEKGRCLISSSTDQP